MGSDSVESEAQTVEIEEAVKAVGADGLIMEVHDDPKYATIEGRKISGGNEWKRQETMREL